MPNEHLTVAENASAESLEGDSASTTTELKIETAIGTHMGTIGPRAAVTGGGLSLEAVMGVVAVKTAGADIFVVETDGTFGRRDKKATLLLGHSAVGDAAIGDGLFLESPQIVLNAAKIEARGILKANSATVSQDVLIGGTLQANGNANFNGGLNVLGLAKANSAAVNEDVTVGRTLQANGNANINGALNVLGLAKAKSATVGEDVIVGRTLQVNGNANINGALNVLGVAKANSANVNEDVVVGRTLQAQSIKARGPIEFEGELKDPSRPNEGIGHDLLRHLRELTEGGETTLHTHPRPSQREQILSLTPILSSVEGRAGWSQNWNGYVEKRAAETSALGVMAVSLPIGATILELRASGRNLDKTGTLEGNGSFSIILFRSSIHPTTPPSVPMGEELAKVKGIRNFRSTSATLSAPDIVSSGSKYHIGANLFDALRDDQVWLTSVQIVYLPV